VRMRVCRHGTTPPPSISLPRAPDGRAYPTVRILSEPVEAKRMGRIEPDIFLPAVFNQLLVCIPTLSLNIPFHPGIGKKSRSLAALTLNFVFADIDKCGGIDEVGFEIVDHRNSIVVDSSWLCRVVRFEQKLAGISWRSQKSKTLLARAKELFFGRGIFNLINRDA